MEALLKTDFQLLGIPTGFRAVSLNFRYFWMSLNVKKLDLNVRGCIMQWLVFLKTIFYVAWSFLVISFIILSKKYR